MKFLFLGAGAIGTYVGGSLAASGHRVCFTERPDVAAQLSERGLVLHIGGEQRSVQTAQFFSSTAEALDLGSPDLVVVALKSFDTAPAVRALVDTARPVPPILTLQNGVDNEATIAGIVGPGRVLSGTVTSAVSKPRLGEIVEEKHRGLGVALGHPLVGPLVEALNEAGLDARTFPEAGPMKWSKLLTNLTGNATSAILDMPVGALFADRRSYQIEVAVLRECLAVMRALGHRPVNLPGTPVRLLALAAERVPRLVAQPLLTRALGAGRGDKMPSFHIDLHSGRGQTEVRWLNGAVAAHGEKLGVPTPVNRMLTDVLESLSAGTENLGRFRGDPQALLDLLK